MVNRSNAAYLITRVVSAILKYHLIILSCSNFPLPSLHTCTASPMFAPSCSQCFISSFSVPSVSPLITLTCVSLLPSPCTSSPCWLSLYLSPDYSSVFVCHLLSFPDPTVVFLHAPGVLSHLPVPCVATHPEFDFIHSRPALPSYRLHMQTTLKQVLTGLDLYCRKKHYSSITFSFTQHF